MILVHKPDTLIKMILRMVVRKVNIEHAGILLYDKAKKTYVATVARGRLGVKIPEGLIRLDPHSPLIRIFTQKEFNVFEHKHAVILGDVVALLNQKEFFRGREELEKLLLAIKFQMESFETLVCVPCYYQEHMFGILMLGEKLNHKPYNPEEVGFFVALANDVAMALRNAFLFEGLQLEIERNKKIFFETTMALSAAIDAKDHYTKGHTTRVTEYSLTIGEKIVHERKEKLHEKFFENLHIASLLHDIGKIGVPESILNKNGSLTEDERKKINEHSMIGATILEPIHDLREVILGVKYHHERYDGRGYPEGLKGDQIPLIAAVIAVADSYDAMTTDRPYRKALTKEQAIAELERCSGTQFDPAIAILAARLLKEQEVSCACPSK